MMRRSKSKAQQLPDTDNEEVLTLPPCSSLVPVSFTFGGITSEGATAGTECGTGWIQLIRS